MMETRVGSVGSVSLAPVRKRWRRFWRRWSDWLGMARRLAPFVGKRKHRLLVALFCGLGYTAVGLAEPWTMKLIIDSVILGHPVPGFLEPALGAIAEQRLLLLNVLIVSIVVLSLLRGLFYYFQSLSTARVGQQVTADIRLELYRHLQSLSFKWHDRRRTGDMISRLTSDIRFLRDIFISLPLSLTSEMFLVVGMVTVMFLMDPTLALLALIALPGIAVVVRMYQRPMRKAIRRQRDREGDIATLAGEMLGAIKVVQGFRGEERELQRFTVQNKRSLRTGLKATRLEAKLRWFAEVTVAVVTALVLAVAARRVLAGALLPGDLIVFVRYLRTFTRPLRRVSRMAERTARGVAAGERVLEMLNVEPAVRDAPDAVPAPRFRGAVELEGVSFEHVGRVPVLQDVDLRIEPGERVALIGPTGVGKSTLVSLIPRFYEPTQGTIRIDGRDIRNFTLATLREQIAFVFQEPILFATSVAENIGYGKADAGMAEIVAAAQEAGIHHIVEGLAEGYDTGLGERGGTLSGGQRQCVAIARALIKDAPIVILDEPTTGLDSEATGMVLRALGRLMRGRTVITISHHFGSIREVDRIVVLEDGRVADHGAPAALVERDGLYARLRQLQSEALAP